MAEVPISDLPEASAFANDDIVVGNEDATTSTFTGAQVRAGLAASGANSDITSLAGLLTPLSAAQGGTGTDSAANHAASHASGGAAAIKLDDLAAPDDNTDLNASATKHGLCPKLSNVSTEFLNGTGAWSTPTASDGNQNANLFKAGPASGAAAAASYRAIQPRDLPYWSSRAYFHEWDHFCGSTSAGKLGWTSAVTGAGSAISASGNSQATNRPGILTMTEGSTSTGRACLHLGAIDHVLGGGAVTIEWWIRIATLSDGSNTYLIYVGGGDDVASGDHVDGVYFGYDSTVSANWLMCTSSNSARTKTASSSEVAADTFYKLRIEVNAAGTSVEYFVDDVSIGTVATNIPTGQTRQFGPNIKIVKSVGTTERGVRVDFWQTYNAYTSAP